MHIALIEPEIPQNTGNIGRICAVTRSNLHLVGKLGFSLDEKALRRAGLDYWDRLQVIRHESFEHLHCTYPDLRFWFFTARASKPYTTVDYRENDFLVFGPETRGLDRALLSAHWDQCVTIPQLDPAARSLNVANAVSIAAYEALRQIHNNFEHIAPSTLAAKQQLEFKIQ